MVNTDKMLGLVGDWKNYLLDAQSQSIDDFAKHEFVSPEYYLQKSAN